MFMYSYGKIERETYLSDCQSNAIKDGHKVGAGGQVCSADAVAEWWRQAAVAGAHAVITAGATHGGELLGDVGFGDAVARASGAGTARRHLQRQPETRCVVLLLASYVTAFTPSA